MGLQLSTLGFSNQNSLESHTHTNFLLNNRSMGNDTLAIQIQSEEIEDNEEDFNLRL